MTSTKIATYMAITELSEHFGMTMTEMRSFLIQNNLLYRHTSQVSHSKTGSPDWTKVKVCYTPTDFASNSDARIVRRKPGTKPGGVKGTWEWRTSYIDGLIKGPEKPKVISLDQWMGSWKISLSDRPWRQLTPTRNAGIKLGRIGYSWWMREHLGENQWTNSNKEFDTEDEAKADLYDYLYKGQF